MSSKSDMEENMRITNGFWRGIRWIVAALSPTGPLMARYRAKKATGRILMVAWVGFLSLLVLLLGRSEPRPVSDRTMFVLFFCLTEISLVRFLWWRKDRGNTAYIEGGQRVWSPKNEKNDGEGIGRGQEDSLGEQRIWIADDGDDEKMEDEEGWKHPSEPDNESKEEHRLTVRRTTDPEQRKVLADGGFGYKPIEQLKLSRPAINFILTVGRDTPINDTTPEQ